MEDEHEWIYQKVTAEHEQYMERVVSYKSLSYIWELVEARRPQVIGAVRLQDGRVTGNKWEVLQEVAHGLWVHHNQGQQGLSETTRRMVRALPSAIMEEQSEAIHSSRVTLGEKKQAVWALKRKKSPGLD